MSVYNLSLSLFGDVFTVCGAGNNVFQLDIAFGMNENFGISSLALYLESAWPETMHTFHMCIGGAHRTATTAVMIVRGLCSLYDAEGNIIVPCLGETCFDWARMRVGELRMHSLYIKC